MKRLKVELLLYIIKSQPLLLQAMITSILLFYLSLKAGVVLLVVLTSNPVYPVVKEYRPCFYMCAYLYLYTLYAMHAHQPSCPLLFQMSMHNCLYHLDLAMTEDVGSIGQLNQ